MLHLSAETRLSPHFTLGELTVAQGINGFFIGHEHLTLEVVFQLRALAMRLEDVRQELREPIWINSGWRPAEYNNQLPDSSKKSYHIKGMAADLRAKDVEALFLAVTRVWQGGVGDGRKKKYVHVDVGPRRAWTYS